MISTLTKAHLSSKAYLKSSFEHVHKVLGVCAENGFMSMVHSCVSIEDLVDLNVGEEGIIEQASTDECNAVSYSCVDLTEPDLMT